MATVALGEDERFLEPVGYAGYREISQTHWATESGTSSGPKWGARGSIPIRSGNSPPNSVSSTGARPPARWDTEPQEIRGILVKTCRFEVTF